jgi:hypothetical protein
MEGDFNATTKII